MQTRLWDATRKKSIATRNCRKQKTMADAGSKNEGIRKQRAEG